MDAEPASARGAASSSSWGRRWVAGPPVRAIWRASVSPPACSWGRDDRSLVRRTVDARAESSRADTPARRLRRGSPRLSPHDAAPRTALLHERALGRLHPVVDLGGRGAE